MFIFTRIGSRLLFLFSSLLILYNFLLIISTWLFQDSCSLKISPNVVIFLDDSISLASKRSFMNLFARLVGEAIPI